jgi:hypothetical protein
MPPAHTSVLPNARSLETKWIALLLLGGRSVVVRQLDFIVLEEILIALDVIVLVVVISISINNYITSNRKWLECDRQCRFQSRSPRMSRYLAIIQRTLFSDCKSIFTFASPDAPKPRYFVPSFPLWLYTVCCGLVCTRPAHCLHEGVSLPLWLTHGPAQIDTACSVCQINMAWKIKQK